MGHEEEIIEPVRRTYAIDQTLTQVREERQVIVHCQLADAEPGMLVIFPSWIQHSALPYRGRRDRFILSANCKIKAI